MNCGSEEDGRGIDEDWKTRKRKSVCFEERTSVSDERSYSDGRNAIGPCPKIQKKTVYCKKIDGHCWICHKLGQDIICNTCPRVYHFKCIRKSSPSFNTSGSCAECQTQSVHRGINSPKIDAPMLKKLLEFAIQQALKENVKKGKTQSQSMENSMFVKFFKSWPEWQTDKLCKIIDLDILIDKINLDSPYLSTGQFFADVKWIHHNCCILYGGNSYIAEAAMKLEKKIKQELLDIEGCFECYYEKHANGLKYDDTFIRVCKEPHEILWAKVRGCPYWPAKCLNIYNGYADVRFFGTHDKSIISLSECYKISKKSPNRKDIKQSKYQIAILELEEYVKEFESHYGKNSFIYYSDMIPLASKKPAKRRRKKKLDKLSWKFCPQVAILDFTIDQEEWTLPSHVPDDFLDPVDAWAPGSFMPPSNVLNTLGAIASHQDTPEFMHSTDMFVPNETYSGRETLMPQFTHSDASHPFPFTTSNFEVGLSSEEQIYLTSESTVQSSEFMKNRSDPNTSSENTLLESSSKTTTAVDDCSADDDEVCIIDEKMEEKQSVKEILRKPDLICALSQVICSNHPHLKDLVNKCVAFGLNSFIRIWLSTATCQTDDYISAFMKLIGQLLEANKCVKEENKYLKRETESLKKAKDSLELTKVAAVRQLINAKNVINVIKATSKRNEEDPILTKNAKQTSCDFPKEYGDLKEKYQNLMKTLEEKDAKLKICEEKISALQKKVKLPSCCKGTLNVATQTLLSDSPDTEMFTVKDLKELNFVQVPHEDDDSDSGDILEHSPLMRMTKFARKEIKGFGLRGETSDVDSPLMRKTKYTTKKIKVFGLRGETSDIDSPLVDLPKEHPSTSNYSKQLYSPAISHDCEKDSDVQLTYNDLTNTLIMYADEIAHPIPITMNPSVVLQNYDSTMLMQHFPEEMSTYPPMVQLPAFSPLPPFQCFSNAPETT